MPDGQFVVFNSAKNGALWKVPIEGGEPTQIFGKRQYNVSISPDAATFAHFTKVDGEQTIVIKFFEDDEVLIDLSGEAVPLEDEATAGTGTNSPTPPIPPFPWWSRCARARRGRPPHAG